MSLIKTIMVAVDLSKYSKPTARYAGQLAQELSADLLFVNVINQRDIDSVTRVMVSYPAFDPKQFIKDRVQSRYEEMNELVKTSDVDAGRSRMIVKTGLPYQQLLDVIETEKPDLLVIATKGRSDIVDVVMGSCARIMHRRSPIPVLSIRGDKVLS